MMTGQPNDVLISLDPAPTLNPRPVDEALLRQILATTVEPAAAAAPRTETEGGRPRRSRSDHHAWVLLACAATAILLAATLGVRSLTTQPAVPATRSPAVVRARSPRRPRQHWGLTASLVGASTRSDG